MSKKAKDILDQLLAGEIQSADATRLLTTETRGRKRKIILGDYEKYLKAKNSENKHLSIIAYWIRLRHANVKAMIARRLLSNAFNVSAKVVDKKITLINSAIEDLGCMVEVTPYGSVLIIDKATLNSVTFCTRIGVSPLNALVCVQHEDKGFQELGQHTLLPLKKA